MKIKDVVGLIMLGFLLRHIDILIEMMITIIGNFQAESAAKIQLRLNELNANANANADESTSVIGYDLGVVEDE